VDLIAEAQIPSGKGFSLYVARWLRGCISVWHAVCHRGEEPISGSGSTRRGDEPMRQWLLRLWREEAGTVPGPEWAVIVTILVLGAVTAVVSCRQATLVDAETPAAGVR
jgi:hypothetical protein